jgi:hypothetical protein
VKIVGGNRYKSGLEYEIINTEEYNQLKNNLTTALDEALNDIKKNLVDSVDNSGQLRQLSTQSINNQRVKVSG